MLEKAIEKKVVDYAKSKGFFVRKFYDSVNGGNPDRIFIYKGFVFFIEFKSEKGRLTKLQKQTILEITKHGIIALVINNVKDGIDLIDKIFYEKK